jgi:hypothetical protein
MGDEKGFVPTPSFSEDILSPQDAGHIDHTLVELSEQVFDLDDEVSKAIAARRKRWTMIYSAVFFVGTLLLVVAKTLEWRLDRNSGSPQTEGVRQNKPGRGR